MKKILYIIIFCFFSITAITSQVTRKELSAVQLIQTRSIYLNSKARADFGGKNRTTIKVDLPKNTKYWFYSFTTQEGENGAKNLNLLAQLSSLVVDPTGMTAAALKKGLNVPSGSSSIDIYTTDQVGGNLFLNNNEFRYLPEGSVENTRQGVIDINDINTGTYYLAIKNPSELNGVNITIEVVAIVEEDIYVDEWNIKSQDIIKTFCVNGFNTNNISVNQVCECTTNKIINKYQPSQWDALSEQTRVNTINGAKEECYKETNNQALKQEESKIIEDKNQQEQDFVDAYNEVADIINSANSSYTVGGELS
jgi:hypothetical protein